MSAFLVSSQSIASIAYALMSKTGKYSLLNLKSFYDLEKSTENMFGIGKCSKTVKPIASWKELADWMHVMNLEALRQRYGIDAMLEDVDGVDLEAKPVKLSAMQLLKSLHCFLYGSDRLAFLLRWKIIDDLFGFSQAFLRCRLL